MTPAAVKVTVSRGPADPVQLAAWRWLWARLLAPEAEHTDAPTGEVEALARDTAATVWCEDLDESQNITS
jgi:hypothetical protein